MDVNPTVIPLLADIFNSSSALQFDRVIQKASIDPKNHHSNSHTHFPPPQALHLCVPSPWQPDDYLYCLIVSFLLFFFPTLVFFFFLESLYCSFHSVPNAIFIYIFFFFSLFIWMGSTQCDKFSIFWSKFNFLYLSSFD